MLLFAHNLPHACRKKLYTIEVKKPNWKEGITCLFTTRSRIEWMHTKETSIWRLELAWKPQHPNATATFLSADCFLFVFCLCAMTGKPLHRSTLQLVRNQSKSANLGNCFRVLWNWRTFTACCLTTNKPCCFVFCFTKLGYFRQ